MAIIPRARPEVSSVGSLPNARNTARIPDNPAAGMADAVRGVAAVGMEIAQKHIDIADTTAVMEGQRAMSEWQASWDDPNNPEGVTAYRGKQALALQGVMLADFDKRFGKLESTMPSERARLKFRESANSERIRIRDRTNQYASGQYQNYLAAENKAFESARSNDLVNAILAGNGGEVASLWKDTETMLWANAMAMGRPDAETVERVRTMKSGIHAAAIENMMATDPAKAEGYFFSHEDDLLPEHRTRVLQALRPVLLDAEAQDIADVVRNGGVMPDGALGFEGVNTSKPAPKLPAEMRDVVEAAADKYGVPRHIALALAWQESSFDPKALGPDTKYGRAKGLFQFIDDTAKAKGIDPFNPAQAADAAMADLAREAKRKGWDWAIAHHYAGPDENQHGPTTRAYVASVREKARRLAGQQGEARIAPAATMTEALERTRHIADPALRQRAETYIRDGFAADEARRKEAAKVVSDSIYQKAIAASPTAPLRSIMAPDELAYLAQDSALSESINRYRKLTATGAVIEDDPILLDQIERMRAFDPQVFKGLLLPQYASRLSGATLLRLSKAQAEAGKPEVTARWASEEQQIGMALSDMAFDKEDAAAMRGQFRKTYAQAKRQFMEEKRREPNADETQAILNKLKLPFVKSGFLGFFGDTRYGFQGPDRGYHVPEDARRKIVEEARQHGVQNPTEAQIVGRYIEMTGDDL